MNMNRGERGGELVREMFPQVLHAATISADQEKRGGTATKPVRRSVKVRSIFCIYTIRQSFIIKKEIRPRFIGSAEKK
jgi:hypothetical protein